MILLRNVVSAIPKREPKMKELVEDLTRMGCEGLLPKPWNLRNEAMLREFLFERGNQWERTMRRDPKQWTVKVWVDVYGFAPRRGEGWASKKNTYFVGKFKAENDPKDRFHLVDCKTPRERTVIEFLLPILYRKKTQAVEHHHGQHNFWGFVRSKASQLGETCPRIGREVDRPQRQETLACLLVPLSPLPTERVRQ